MKNRKRGLFIVVVILLILGSASLGIRKLLQLQIWDKEVKSVNVDGIIATVEEIQADRQRAIIKVNLKKEDGTPMDEKTRVGMIEIFSKQGISGYHTSMALSEDHKSLNYTFLVSPPIEEEMGSKKVYIWLNGLVSVEEKQQVLDESIYDLYEKFPLKKSYEEGDSEGYIPIEDVNEFSILGVGFTKKSSISEEVFESEKPILYMRTAFGGNRQTTDNEAWINDLYNEQTGETISSRYACSLYETKYEKQDRGEKVPEELEIMERYYDLTSTDDLKHIKSIMNYNIKHQVDHNKRALFVKIKENVASISQKVNVEVNVKNMPFKITEVYISSLGATIKGNVIGEQIIAEAINIPSRLYMKDGTYINLETTSYPTDRVFEMEYRCGEAIDIEQIECIEIAGEQVQIIR